MCTGSGCILISTLYYAGKDYPKIVGVGVDISKEALEVSKENAIRNGFNVTKVESLKELVYNKYIENNESQIILIKSNLFAKLDAMLEDSYCEEKSKEINNCEVRNTEVRNTEVGNREDIIAKRNEITEKYNIILSNPPYIPTSQISSLEEEVKCHDPILALDGGEDGLYFYRNIVEKSREYLVNEGVLILECGWNQGEAVSEIMKKQGYVDVKIIKDLSGLDRVVLGSY
jgi:release factor glutamine methyltransferase